MTSVAAKSYVVPLKSKSIPRIELMATVVMCRLARSVIDSLKICFEEKWFWWDSQVVIY